MTCCFFGAEGETRTLAPVARPTPLAGAPRHQLEYFCKLTGLTCQVLINRCNSVCFTLTQDYQKVNRKIIMFQKSKG